MPHRLPPDDQAAPTTAKTPRMGDHGTLHPGTPALRPDNLASVLSDAARLDPDFFEELATLSMTVDEYERLLAADEPTVVTTDNTVG